MLQTEYEFILPKGYIDPAGNIHRQGTMRLATALDEIEPLRDPMVRENEAYLTILLLTRVITQLGTLPEVTPSVVEKLFSADLAHLENLYRLINDGEQALTPETIAIQSARDLEQEVTAPLGG